MSPYGRRKPEYRPGERRAPDPLEVLTTREMASWFKTSERTIQRRFRPLPDMPGHYMVSDVLEQIKKKRGRAA